MGDFPARDNSLVGAAGVHFVVSELSLRNLIALPTIRNTAGVDILVSSKTGDWHANLQVKASRNYVSFWPISTHYEEWVSPNNYYVFLRYDGRKERFEAFLESSQQVAENVRRVEQLAREKGNKPWAPCFYPDIRISTKRSRPNGDALASPRTVEKPSTPYRIHQ